MSRVSATEYHQILDRVERNHWWFVSLRELVVETLTDAVPAGSWVLDAGCSTGHVIAQVPPHYERTGADVSSGAIELAGTLRPGIGFVEATVEDLPFPDGSFDAVLAIDVLSDKGVADDAAALRGLRRVLRPGGALVVQVPAYEWLRGPYDDLVGGRRYTARSVRSLLDDGGFGIEHLAYRITALFPLAVARRLVAPNASADDLEQPRPALNRLLAGTTRLENRIARRLRCPFGLSVFAVATAPGRRTPAAV